MKKSILYSSMLITGFTLMSCNTTINSTFNNFLAENNNVSLKVQIAQKIMIDLRYYCDQDIVENSKKHCNKPVTKLPSDLAKIITDTNIAGVILFSDNIINTAQIIQLTHDLQQAAALSSFKSPLLISVDQEGGRVFRTPRAETVAFTGNMSIGATYHKYGSYFATESARIMGKELKLLGFNVNHAPTVDVNANPENPVINVRSFGEDPKMVAELGQAQVEAFQQQGIISTIKHFPGHGDTATDSHTGLPRVDHNIKTIYEMDIAPFKQIIDTHSPGMIMTAHIQYPQLDNSTFVAKDGKSMIKPATMSRVILTDILREELHYKGVIVTDALDMAGIEHFFNETDAVINTFKAGADIALMPIKIRSPKDLDRLVQLIDDVVEAIKDKQLNQQEVYQSFLRIQTLKSTFALSESSHKTVADKIKHAAAQLSTPEHREMESLLAEKAITFVAGDLSLLPIRSTENIHLIMPDRAKCIALKDALKLELGSALQITCTSMQHFNFKDTLEKIKRADIILASHISPKQSAVEMGGMDDLKANQEIVKRTNDPQDIYDLLAAAKEHQKKTIFISLRTPYEITLFKQVADISLATYAYNTHINASTKQIVSPAFTALAKLLSGKINAEGSLPVTVN